MQDSCVLRLSSDVILCASPSRRRLTPSSSRWKAKEMAIVDTHNTTASSSSPSSSIFREF